MFRAEKECKPHLRISKENAHTIFTFGIHSTHCFINGNPKGLIYEVILRFILEFSQIISKGLVMFD